MESQTNQSAAFDVWSLAKDLQKKQTQSSGYEKTLIVVGERSSGKTAFIKVLKSENDSETKPTCAIDYTFIRKTGVKKQIINCYEIASRNLRAVIGGSLLNKQSLDGLHFVISIDLGEPSDIIDNTLAWIQIIRQQSQNFLRGLDPQILSKYQQRINRALEHQDSGQINALPIPTILLMNKYDLYQKYETEVRKWISRAIRYLAHTNGCSVFTNSIKLSSLSAQVRSIFHTFIGDSSSSFNQKDHLKSIYISFGNDNIGSMSLPHTGSMKMQQALKKQIQGLVGIKQKKGTDQFDFSKYKEQRIDQLIRQKEKEFEVIGKKNRAKNSQNQEGPLKRKIN